jgi:hypothetical protein
MAVDYTPWVDGVTEYKAAQMNAPLTELKESAQDELDLKAALEHEHVVADITDFPSELTPEAHSHTTEGAVGISFEETTKPLANGAYSVIIPYEMIVPADASTSGFYNKTNPSAEVEVSIKDDGTEIATLTVAADGTPTWATVSGTEKTIAAGSLVSFVFPAQDSTWSGVVITLVGEREI